VPNDHRGASLGSFRSGLRALVVGSQGGVGAAFVAALATSPQVGIVYAAARHRTDAAVADQSGKVVDCRIDINDEPSIAALAEQLRAQGPLDLVLVATGILHAASALQPEKSWRQLDAESLAKSFQVNAIGPALVAKHLLDLLVQGHKSVFGALSARVGSIDDNRLGGWHSYRASKAALNMLLRTCAIELVRRNPTAICVSLHPGTVDTALSKPFQTNVPQGKLFTPEFAATQLLQVVERLDVTANGGFFAWDGQQIPF